MVWVLLHRGLLSFPLVLRSDVPFFKRQGHYTSFYHSCCWLWMVSVFIAVVAVTVCETGGHDAGHHSSHTAPQQSRRDTPASRPLVCPPRQMRGRPPRGQGGGWREAGRRGSLTHNIPRHKFGWNDDKRNSTTI